MKINKILSAGTLAVMTMAASLNAKDFSGAELYTNEEFSYGKFEARMKMAAASDTVSSMFLYRTALNRPAQNAGSKSTSKFSARNLRNSSPTSLPAGPERKRLAKRNTLSVRPQTRDSTPMVSNGPRITSAGPWTATKSARPRRA